MQLHSFMLKVLAVAALLCSLTGAAAATAPPPAKMQPPPPLRVLSPPPPVLHALPSSPPPPRKVGPPPPSAHAPPPPLILHSPPPPQVKPAGASPPPPKTILSAPPKSILTAPPPKSILSAPPPPLIASPGPHPPPPKLLSSPPPKTLLPFAPPPLAQPTRASPPPPKTPMSSPPPPLTKPTAPHPPPPKSLPSPRPPPPAYSAGPMTYIKTLSPPSGFQFCYDTAAKISSDPDGSTSAILFGYVASFPVLYCTSEGDPAGTVAIWSYVAPDLCSTTSFNTVSAQGDAASYTIMIGYNGVGTITTQSQAIPIISNKYTIAGPDWYPYDDDTGDVSYTYHGTDTQFGPSPFGFTTGLTPCGTPFAGVLNNQVGTSHVPQCDAAGNVKGTYIGATGFAQDICMGRSVTAAQVYIDAGLDSDGNPAINAELIIYYI